jgi:hypothetical protein
VDLTTYRHSAEEFHIELMRAYYRHYAGLDEQFAIEPIYERHAQLFERAAVDALRGETDAAAPDSEERRRLTLLLGFAVEGLLGQATKALEAELAEREARLSVAVNGDELGFRQSAVAQANEADAERRAAIEAARLETIDEQLNPLYRELIERHHALARELGYTTYREMCQELKAIDLPALQAETDAFAADTETDYPALLEPQLERVLGFGFAELRRSDLPRFFRDPEADVQFPADRLVPSFLESLRGLGIGRQDNVLLDVEPRPNKSPRAFCAGIRIPEEVCLVIAPIGGRDDFSALFHESGHTEHFAHVDPELPFEFRCLGDNSITECFAFLNQHLIDDPVWLERRLGIADPSTTVAYARSHRLLYLRRYTGKLAYEMELHGPGGGVSASMADRYAELLGRALHLTWSPQTYLADVDPGFYSACYLRAWALETSLRAHFRERYGPAWFDSPEAGAELRSLWRQGQRMTPDELLAEIGRPPLRFGALLRDLGLG